MSKEWIQFSLHSKFSQTLVPYLDGNFFIVFIIVIILLAYDDVYCYDNILKVNNVTSINMNLFLIPDPQVFSIK